MFTGIIEEIGRVRRITQQAKTLVLHIEATKVLKDVSLGDSIAVNGVCLTVTAFDAKSASFDVMPETFRHTNLSRLQIGSSVNLERAMQLNGRFGGHIVSGHVDCTGQIAHRYVEDNAHVFRIEPDNSQMLKYIMTRGSVTLDGISLTVVEVTDTAFTVSIIPHTLVETILKDKQAGDSINIECDMLAKYMERLLHYRELHPSARQARSKIDERFLAEHGFI